MNDNDILTFIGELQLKCGQKNKEISDTILNTFEEFREGNITREECINLVLIYLTDFPKLAARFAKICETVPNHQSRYGSIVHEPFINSVIEFELWPNSLSEILSSARKAFLGETTMNDFFYDIEKIKNTSGPFWLLWDLFQEILPNSIFLQSIFDGCVSKETIPDHIDLDIKPSDFDKDRSLLTYNSIIDSDLVCCYPNDYRCVPYQIGILKRGSYGLLSRKKVDLKCSGRSLLDFAVSNDRWAVNATGAEPCFKPSTKNQYEEKLFDVENERIEMDVRLERIKSSNSRIKNLILKIQNSQNQSNYFDSNTFPKGVFTALDILTLKELYLEPNSSYENKQNKLQKLYEQIVRFPLESLKIISERIDEKISSLQEIRKNKEKEYYEISRRNYPRSLEVRNIERNTLQPAQIEVITDESEILKLTNKGIQSAVDIISQTYQLMTSKEQSFNEVMELVNLLFKIKIPEPHENLVKKYYPSFHELNIQDNNTLFFSRDMVRIIKSFYKIECTLTNILSIETQPQQEIIESNSQKMHGLSLASSIGFVGQDSQSNSKEDSMKESLPLYFAGSRNNVNLESLFETQLNLPYQSLDSLKKAVCNFIKNSTSFLEDPNSKFLIDKLKSYTSEDYFITTLEAISGRPYYSVCINFQDEFVEVKFQKKLPRLSFLRNNYLIIPSNLKDGPALISSREIEKQQEECLVRQIKKSKRVLSQRNTVRNFEFRLGQKEIQFKKSAINYIKKNM